MVTQQNNLFRKKALENLSSPERLDRVMTVIQPMHWLSLAALGSLVATAVIWSIVGRIPIAVSGQGVLVYPSKVVSLQAPASGRILAMNINVGDYVKKGQVLAIIDQAELQSQLQQQRAKLAQLQSQNYSSNLLQGQRKLEEKRAIAQQRLNLQQRLQQAISLTPILRNRGLSSLQVQQQNLLQSRAIAVSMISPQRKIYEGLQKLQAEGGISQQNLLEQQQTYLDAVKKVSDIDAQLKQLDVQQVEIEKTYRENFSQINDFQSQLQELDANEKTKIEQDFDTASNRQNQIQEVKQNIAQLQVQLNQNSQIVSEYNGRVLEISTSFGQIVSPGSSIAVIQAEEPSAKLMGLTFFSVGDGKKIHEGMKVQITPSTVERERFGGIVGTVTHVSAFPVTKEGALNAIGNAEVVQSLMAPGPQIQVEAELQPDDSTFSGYKWSSSKGVDMKISSGTTTSVRVTTEERSPISFIFPFLKSLTGVN
ncbi:NHLP bacteriocin system secretion protein [Nostoc calcicola FACHB-389]|nr:NHLP bacteriocin system secretion protein [Nostoc calcicola FACHB-3891]OKH29466.1 NHLP bacteriocin system secretion protein [Nostoc calcicola FACHB-389]